MLIQPLILQSAKDPSSSSAGIASSDDVCGDVYLVSQSLYRKPTWNDHAKFAARIECCLRLFVFCPR